MIRKSEPARKETEETFGLVKAENNEYRTPTSYRMVILSNK